MARLLRSEIYSEINSHLCGLEHLDKENKYKTQLDELEIQNKYILQNSLTSDSYLKLIYRANITETCCFGRFGNCCCLLQQKIKNVNV